MKKSSHIKFRHKLTRKLVYPLIGLYVKLKSGVKIEKFKGKDKGPYLVLFNHQTGYDQFIVSLSFKFPVYFVSSDDVLSNGFYSRLVEYGVAPIPIKKNVADANAVLKCKRVANEGGTIAIAPEGNRTYSGETCYINPAIGGFVKLLNLPVIIYKIEGGYNALPRWADKAKKGKLRGFVSKVIPTSEFKSLTKEEINKKLKEELYNNDYNLPYNYVGKRKAEYLERVAYVCPKCGLSVFESNKNFIKCNLCALKVEYLDNKELKCESEPFHFKTFNDWYKYQNEFVNKLNLVNENSLVYYNDNVKLYKVIPRKKKVLLNKNVTLNLFNDKIEVVMNDKNVSATFTSIEGVSVLGRNKLNVYFNKEVYQFKGSKRFNAVKYLNFYHRYKNELQGDGNEFLGL